MPIMVPTFGALYVLGFDFLYFVGDLLGWAMVFRQWASGGGGVTEELSFAVFE
eukprot:CAMPEP_0194561116 /NCGR_PEP_ID=MMETSP0292-20121207/2037_1 /TAXON_ID=39354 /ORGANISM="Heterosigma akashiwo, Strain CCMP2393" /LENGTH=52 /DNA_ID=CAMNT_0039409455 /DNA_START=150 /DNA_END=305 /DNA_ORIENTATION=+